MYQFKLLTIKETCEILQIGTTAIYRLIKIGALTSVKIGGSTRVEQSELERYIAACRAKTSNKAA